MALIDNEFIPPYIVHLLNEKSLITEKLNAALTRSHPRDFFDVYFLLIRGGIIKSDQKALLKQTTEIMKAKKINFKKELEIFLPRNLHQIASNFQEVYTKETQKYF